MAADTDFTFIRILQPAIEPAVVYKVSNRSLYRNTMLVIARLWTRPVTLENQLCLKCNNTYQDKLLHVTCVCPSTLALHNQFTDSLASILLSDEILRVLELDSVSQTLRLLGAPVEPIFDVPSEIALIVNCIHTYKSTLSTANTNTVMNQCAANSCSFGHSFTLSYKER